MNLRVSSRSRTIRQVASAETYQPARISSSGRGQPAPDPADLLRPSRASAAAAVGVEEAIKGLGQVTKAVDPGDPDLAGGEFFILGLGNQGARDGEGLGLQGQLVLGALAHQDQPGLAGQLARLKGPEGFGEPGRGFVGETVAPGLAARAVESEGL